MKIHVLEGRLAEHMTEAAVFVHFSGEEIPVGVSSLFDEYLEGAVVALMRTGDFKGEKTK